MRFLLLCLLLNAVPAMAADFYVVPDVAINMEITNPQTARDEALAAAQAQAYEALRAAHALPAADSAQLNRLMQDFEVSGERISATRYVGTFTIRFRPSALETLKAGAGDNTATPISPGVPAAGTVAQSAILTRSVVQLSYNNLPEYNRTLAKLRQNGTVQQVVPLTFRRKSAELEITHRGTLADLQTALLAQSITLTSPFGGGMPQLIDKDN